MVGESIHKHKVSGTFCVLSSSFLGHFHCEVVFIFGVFVHFFEWYKLLQLHQLPWTPMESKVKGNLFKGFQSVFL